MTDQEEIDMYKSLLGAVINVLDLPKSELDKYIELKIPPHQMTKKVIQEKNDKIEFLQEKLAGINKLSSFKF